MILLLLCAILVIEIRSFGAKGKYLPRLKDRTTRLRNINRGIGCHTSLKIIHKLKTFILQNDAGFRFDDEGRM